MKRLMIWTSTLLLIVGSWGGNIWYYNSMQLDEPIFLKHHIAVNGLQGEMIELYFLENKKVGKKVTGIYIENLPQLHFQLHESSHYRHQVLKKASAIWDPETVTEQQQLLEPIIIGEVTVYYNEGQQEQVPVGEINIDWHSREDILEGVSSSGSSDGSGSSTKRVKRSVTLEKIDYDYSDVIERWFTLRLSDQPVDSLSFPIELSQGDLLSFSYQWAIPDDEQAAYEDYEIKINLYFRTEDGRTVIEQLPVNFNLYLNEKQVKRLVRSGGEL